MNKDSNRLQKRFPFAGGSDLHLARDSFDPAFGRFKNCRSLIQIIDATGQIAVISYI